jgi:hypothetical protein
MEWELLRLSFKKSSMIILELRFGLGDEDGVINIVMDLSLKLLQVKSNICTRSPYFILYTLTLRKTYNRGEQSSADSVGFFFGSVNTSRPPNHNK